MSAVCATITSQSEPPVGVLLKSENRPLLTLSQISHKVIIAQKRYLYEWKADKICNKMNWFCFFIRFEKVEKSNRQSLLPFLAFEGEHNHHLP